jgi:hypothetical protein
MDLMLSYVCYYYFAVLTSSCHFSPGRESDANKVSSSIVMIILYGSLVQ